MNFFDWGLFFAVALLAIFAAVIGASILALFYQLTFGRRAGDLIRRVNAAYAEEVSRHIDESKHVNRCPQNITIRVPNDFGTYEMGACWQCYESMWKHLDAEIIGAGDKRGAPSLKEIGPEGIAV